MKNPEIKRKQSNNWVEKNREKVNAGYRQKRKENRQRYKGYALKKDFGISLEDYNVMFQNQSGLCAICGEKEKTKHQSGHLKDLAVDHNHVTGRIRGLLCWVCNTGIGKLKDSPELLRKAADYIERNS